MRPVSLRLYDMPVGGKSVFAVATSVVSLERLVVLRLYTRLVPPSESAQVVALRALSVLRTTARLAESPSLSFQCPALAPLGWPEMQRSARRSGKRRITHPVHPPDQLLLALTVIHTRMTVHNSTFRPSDHKIQHEGTEVVSDRLVFLVGGFVRRDDLIAEHTKSDDRIQVEVFRQLVFDDLDFVRLIYMDNQSGSSAYNRVVAT